MTARLVHLAASAFVGGPESQVLGLIGAWPAGASAVLSFSEGGRCRALLDAAARRGAVVVELRANTPHYRAAVREIADHLRRLDADAVLCHGYKPDILGLLAARRAGVPALALAHGWTAATWKVRLNETIDRLCMRRMDRVVCVSEAQARKVRAAGVPAGRVAVIRNAIDPALIPPPDPSERAAMLGRFGANPPRRIVGAVGRLSPEKGFGVLVEAAARVVAERPDVGFLHHGDGPLRPAMERRIGALGLADRFVLGGFRPDVTRVVANLDALALPSFTEGLPCVVLEAFAAGVPVVATAVGGTPEVVVDATDARVEAPIDRLLVESGSGRGCHESGVSNLCCSVTGARVVDNPWHPEPKQRAVANGRLVAPGDPSALARALLELLDDPSRARSLGANGRALVLDRFTFAAQADAYHALLADVRWERGAGGRPSGPAAISPRS